MTPSQRRRKIRRKRHHYRARLFAFIFILTLGALGCIYVDTICSYNNKSSLQSYDLNLHSDTAKQDWQYEIELEKAEIMKYSMQ